MNLNIDKNIIFVVVFFVFIYSLVYYLFGSVGDYVSLYFYSAVLQGNSALITLTAMFIIFKRQILDNRYIQIEKVITEYLSKSANVCVNYSDVLSLEKMSEEMIKNIDESSKKKIKENEESDVWKSRFDELKNINCQKKLLWDFAMPSFIGLFFILIISIIFLSLASYIHSFRIVEIILLSIISSLESISLYYLYRFIKNLSIDQK